MADPAPAPVPPPADPQRPPLEALPSAADTDIDVVVVTTTKADDIATRERLLAARAMKRIETRERRHREAGERQGAGVALMKSSDYEGAAAAFGQACNLWRTNPVVHCDLATAYLHLGRFEDAEASASNALNLDPRLVEARYVRGMARQGRGVLKAALVDFQTVLELEPSNESAQAQLKDLTAAVEAEAAAAAVAVAAAAAASTTPEGDATPTPTTAPKLDPDFDPAYPLITPTKQPLLPTLDPELLSTSDTSDAQHTGTAGTPCLFYNHGGCLRGAACAFSHAPDHKSVRDGLGKNVCLYFLLGLCKFGKGKCIYSHERKWLAEGGWWDDEGVVERVKGRVEREREGRRERREEREKEKERRKGERKARKDGEKKDGADGEEAAGASGKGKGKGRKGKAPAAAAAPANANGPADPSSPTPTTAPNNNNKSKPGHRKNASRSANATSPSTSSSNDPLTAEIEARLALFASMGVPVGSLSPADVLRQMQAIAAAGVMPVGVPLTPLSAGFNLGVGVNGMPISPGLQLQAQFQMQQMQAAALAQMQQQAHAQAAHAQQQQGEAVASQIRELEGRMRELKEKEKAAAGGSTSAGDGKEEVKVVVEQEKTEEKVQESVAEASA